MKELPLVLCKFLNFHENLYLLLLNKSARRFIIMLLYMYNRRRGRIFSPVFSVRRAPWKWQKAKSRFPTLWHADFRRITAMSA